MQEKRVFTTIRSGPFHWHRPKFIKGEPKFIFVIFYFRIGKSDKTSKIRKIQSSQNSFFWAIVQKFDIQVSFNNLTNCLKIIMQISSSLFRELIRSLIRQFIRQFIRFRFDSSIIDWCITL